MNHSYRASALVRGLAAFQASLLMFSLVGMSFPMQAFAQEADQSSTEASVSSDDSNSGNEQGNDSSSDEEGSSDEDADQELNFLGFTLQSHDHDDDDKDKKDKDDHKIEICHVTPGKSEIKEVDANGWNGHDGHEGDFLITDENRELCEGSNDEHEHGDGTLTVVKVIVGNDDASPADFSFTVTATEDGDNSSEVHTYPFDADGSVSVPVDDDEDKTYTVTEVDPGSDYTVSYSGSCDEVSTEEDGEATCTITNTFVGEPEAPQMCSIVSDTTDFYIEGNHNAVPTFVHGAWTSIPGALWIWGDALVQHPRDGETQSFEKEFNVTGSPTSATLQYAADNGTVIKVNGVTVVDQNLPGLTTSDFHFNATDSVAITNLHAGVNKIEITVRNIPFDTDSATDNPAGVIYKLDVTGADCVDLPYTTVPTPEPTVCTPGVELLKNGDFESPSVSAGGWDLFPSEVAGLSWIVDWLGAPVSGRPAVANIEIQNGVNGWSAAAPGSQWAELDSDWSTSSTGNPSATVISQDIPTVVGETYTFSFDASPRPGTDVSDNTLEAVAGGTTLGTVGPLVPAADTVWSHQSYSFTATSTVTRVSLRDAGANNNSFGALVDNASLTCNAPEVPAKTAKLHTVKIVCDDESYLPNWGEGTHADITADTAADFLTEVNAGHETPVCHLAPDWQFQWVTNAVSALNPGDNDGIATAPWHTTGVTGVDGSVETNIPVGDKVWVREVLKDGYVPFAGGSAVEDESGDVDSAEIYCATDVLNYDNWDWIDPVEADEDYYCVAFNAPQKETPPAPTKATILAAKVMCDAEQYLPNSGDIARPITAGTAAAWVAQSNGHCHMEDGYDFQWTWSTADPDDNGTEPLGSPWTTFGSTDETGLTSTEVTVSSPDILKVREILKTGDVQYANDEAGAKFYCATDVAGVDNWEWINAEAGNTYYCVAFNAHPTTDNPGDGDTGTVSVHIAKYLDGVHATAENADAASFPMITTYHSAVHGNGTDVPYTLDQNGWFGDPAYEASYPNSNKGSDYTTHEVTGTNVGETCEDGKPFALLGYSIGTSFADAAGKEPSDIVPNFPNLQSDQYVIVWNETCDNGGGNPGGGDTDGTIVIVKHAVGGSGTFTFNLSELTPDVVGFDASITTDEYGTTTLTRAPGIYNLTENQQEGWTLQGVTCEYEGASEGQAITNGKTIEVVGGETVTCTFTNTKNNVSTVTDHTTVVRAGDLADDFTEVATNAFTQWFFYNDESDTINSALGSFVDGPETAPLGEGSAQMSVTGTERRNIATYQFKDVPLSKISELSFSTYSQSAGNGSPASERSAYLNFNVDFNNSDTFQRRLVFLPSINGTVVNDEWQNWDAIQGGAALWLYSGNFWPAGSVSNGSIPGTTARPWSDILADYPNVQTRSTDSWFGFRVGEPYNDGFTGNVDNVVVGITTGTNTHTETYDFEPNAEVVVTPNDENGGGNGGGGSSRRGQRRSSSSNDGEVLGASTEACVPLITKYIRLGWDNDAAEVMKLQNFLNGEMGASLPLTGFFGPLTAWQLGAFQAKYWEDVLKPWVSTPGQPVINAASDATGFLYKTTKWKINNLVCPGSETLPLVP